MASSVLEDRLAYFVDRDEEMKRFCAMIEGGAKRILSVCGGEGIGKSLLMERMVHDCALRKRRTAKVVCRDTRNDALFIMRSIRDDLPVECFEAFTRCLNTVTAPSAPNVTFQINAPITVGQGMTVEGGGRVGDMSAVRVTQDLMVDRPDIARREKERLAQLTDAFVEGLRAAVQAEPAVVFIDDCQKMMPETDLWLRDELLFAVQDGPLANAYFVLLSQKQPDLKSYSFLAHQAELGPLTRDHIAAYLEKRKIDEKVRPDMVMWLWVATSGRIADIERIVQAYLEERRQASP
jgi:hypothetical protein